jgi:Activator of Hsp90 ATPase homolog 1-like protein
MQGSWFYLNKYPMKKHSLSITVTFLLIINNYSGNAQNAVSTHTLTLKNKNTGMQQTDFTSTILVSETPATVFNAVKNFRAWWSEEIKGHTDVLNETFFYHFKEVHLCRIKLIELSPDRKLVYEVVANEFSFVKDKTEWVGTQLIFDISQEAGKTKIVFTHKGLVPGYECYNVCHDAWTSYIQGSLNNLITTGKGKPNAEEGGLNAELVEKWGLPTKHINAEIMKKEKSYSTSIVVDKSAAEVFKAINDPRGWWQGEIAGNTDKLNEEFTYQVDDVHFSKQKITELVAGKKVVWLVTESNLGFVAKKDEWTNTKVQFDISTEEGKTKLTFTHHGLVPSFECYGGCSGAWESLIERSLFSFITTGKGIKVF